MNKPVVLLIAVAALVGGVQAQDYSWSGLNAQTLSFYRQGNYDQALRTARQSLQLARQAGENHPAVALSMNNLGLIYRAKGHYQQAESIYLYALTLGEETRGRRISLPLKGTLDKPEIDLGRLLEEQLKQQLEEQLEENILEGLEKLLGKEATDAR